MNSRNRILGAGDEDERVVFDPPRAKPGQHIHSDNIEIAENFGDFNVIGMNVLARLGSWRVEDNTLILVPRAEDTIS
ncbi:hypothetical protein A3711_14405 [Erythrobacter sp. HI00D59]|nr:hypothetical protein A3711_14405 [Erythrobacter sp. HI00D59]